MNKLLLLFTVVSSVALGQAYAPSGSAAGTVTTGSGAATGRVPYYLSSTTLGGSSNLVWDATNFRLGIQVSSPAYPLDVSGYIHTDSGLQVDVGGNVTAPLIQAIDGSGNVSLTLTGVNTVRGGLLTTYSQNSGSNVGLRINTNLAQSGSTKLLTIENLGTVEVSVSNSGAVTATSFTGSLTGNVTGNLTGNVTGAVTGNVTGNLTGNVTGNLTGNVTGNASGTAGGLSSTLAVGSGGTGQVTATAAFDALAPSQTGNSGKYLTTNGSTTSWGTVSSGLSGSLTATRVPVASGASTLVDDSSFIYDTSGHELRLGGISDQGAYVLQTTGSHYLGGNIANATVGYSAGSQTSMGYIHFNLTTDSASSPQAGIGFAVNLTGGTSNTHIGGISMGKENSTSANALSFMSFNLSNSSTVSIVEAARFTSSGILRGTVGGNSGFQISGNASDGGNVALKFGNSNSLSNSGAVLAHFYSDNFTTSKVKLVQAGDIYAVGSVNPVQSVHSTNRSVPQATEYGTATASSNSVTVTFGTAFTNTNVFCTCSVIDTTAISNCSLNAAASATAVTFKTTGATDVINYRCDGDR